MTYDEFKHVFGKEPIMVVKMECTKCGDCHFIYSDSPKGTFNIRNKCYKCWPSKPKIRVSTPFTDRKKKL